MKLSRRSGIGTQLNPRASRLVHVGDWETCARVADAESEDAAHGNGVALIDVSAGRRFLAQGHGLDAAFDGALQPRPIGARELAVDGESWAFRTRRDEAYISAPVQGELPRFRELVEKTGGLWTEVTDGFDVIALVGPMASTALSKLCSLDLDADRFPDRTAAWGGLAKISGLIVRLDRAGNRAYEVHVDRSLGAYLWDTLLDASAELGGLACGTEALPR